jgi:3-keto-5-aminohexanoate cleavage enzyme
MQIYIKEGGFMEKLIITVTVDSSMSYPGNHYCPPPKMENVGKIVDEYVRSVNAGASMCHIHGVHQLEDKIAEDGKKLSHINFEGWKAVHQGIKAKVDCLMQYGIASARFEEKSKLMDQGPDLMSINFTAHDEYFRPDPKYPPVELYAVHPREELEMYCREMIKKGVKTEVESFTTGAFWNIGFIRNLPGNILPDPVYTTLFMGWPGGTYTYPDMESMLCFVHHLPKNCVWNLSNMDSKTHWQNLSWSICLGGHVRVGWEDNPYIDGKLADSNARLVEKIVRIARDLGREIATPDEARKILGLKKK